MENVETTTKPDGSKTQGLPNAKLFDATGKLIPTPDSRVYNQVSRGYFTVAQPKLDFAEIHARTQTYLGACEGITRSDFEARCQNALEKLEKDPRTEWLLKGVQVPFFLPRAEGSVDIGLELDSKFLPAVKKSYEEKYPKYKCTNYLEGKLEGRIAVAPDCRYEELLEARNAGPVVGWYFPNPLAEYAIPNQRRLVENLPEGLILSGGIEAAAAFVGTPEIILKTDGGHYPHLLALSALEPRSGEKFFFFFEAYGWNLEFNSRSYQGAVSEYWAGGLTVLA